MCSNVSFFFLILQAQESRAVSTKQLFLKVIILRVTEMLWLPLIALLLKEHWHNNFAPLFFFSCDGQFMTHLSLLETSFAQVCDSYLFWDVFRGPNRSLGFTKHWARQEQFKLQGIAGHMATHNCDIGGARKSMGEQASHWQQAQAAHAKPQARRNKLQVVQGACQQPANTELWRRFVHTAATLMSAPRGAPHLAQ